MLKTGTSLLACAFDGGVVLGSDSRITTGQVIVGRSCNKIMELTDNISICMSGSVADVQIVVKYVRYWLDMHETDHGSPADVDTAARLCQLLCYENKDSLMAGLIVGGHDKRNGGSLYSIPLGGTLVKQNFAAGGSGSTYLYGWCDANFKNGMTKEEAHKFVVDGLSHAIARDGASGGSLRVLTMSAEGTKRETVDYTSLPYALDARTVM